MAAALLVISKFSPAQENSIGQQTGGMSGSLVAGRDYQKAIGLSDEQVEQFEELNRAFNQQTSLIWQKLPNLIRRRSVELYQQREAEREAAFAELEKEFFDKTKSILTEDQLNRHLQLQSWSYLVSKGRFAFFYENAFTQHLKMPSETVIAIEREAKKIETQFDAGTRKELDELQQQLLQEFTDSQRKGLMELGMPLDFSKQNNYANATLRRYYVEWDRESLDDSFHGSFTFKIHSMPENAQRLGLDFELIKKLDQLNMDVNERQSEELAKARQTRKLGPESSAKISREVADEYLPILGALLDEKMDQHEILQYEFRARILGPFRQYGDPWLLKRLNVSGSQEKKILQTVEACLKDFDKYLIDETQRGWRKLVSKLDTESRQKFEESLGEMPSLFIGHLGQ